jgi:hypothetical protein
VHDEATEARDKRRRRAVMTRRQNKSQPRVSVNIETAVNTSEQNEIDEEAEA